MLRKDFLLIIAIAVLALSGCAGSEATKPVVEDKSVGTPEPAPAAAPDSAQGKPLDAAPKVDPLAKRRVYFTFDSSAVDDENRALIEAHAAYLAANRSIKVTLEGHADERGTREYNLALGERRAQAVERMFKVLGVSADRIKTVSYGEEKPVALDHDESAWALNRRVEIIY